MSKPRFVGDRFHIDDFQNREPFCSFLPAVAGKDGKPLWAFYASVGQAMGGFGVTSKDTPITPFDSARLAYANIPTRGFRTFLKVGDKVYTPFFGEGKASRSMETSIYDLSIKEVGEGYTMEVVYATAPRQNFPALIRKVTFTNTSDKEAVFTIADGLPLFFPQGLSNLAYKETVSLMEAYCQVDGLEEKTPFVKFKTSTGDNAVVEENKTGNGYFAKDDKGRLLSCIVDPSAIYDGDRSLLTAKAFNEKSYNSFIKTPQQTENKLPCAFVGVQTSIKPGESYTIREVYGSFLDYESFKEAEKRLNPRYIDDLLRENRELVEDLVAPVRCKTGDPTFDLFATQSYLDNNLRGGFPYLLPDGKGGQVYYLYGRKHGDMERDYNAFRIPARYYSSGPGNFRDVNQNRRNDLFFKPYVGDYNIRLFFSLIQADGQNPLNVKPSKFVLDDFGEAEKLSKQLGGGSKKLTALLSKPFEPCELFNLLVDDLGIQKWKAEAVSAEIFGKSHQEWAASFAEGYWVDHWTYNVDLLENYSSIFPDKEEELFFGSAYPYFHSPVYVEPRSEKYSLLPDGRVRQYGAIDLKGLREKCQREGIDVNATAWLKDKNGRRVETDLASKMVNLVLVKWSTLDSLQLGIEMECEKPGWNDAMNGLPGLFGSGLSETVELLRLLSYSIEHLSPFKEKEIAFLREQYEFYEELKRCFAQFSEGKLSRFDYWDAATSAREKLRYSLRDQASGETVKVSLEEVLEFLSAIKPTLQEAIKRGKEIGGGILPSYLVYDLSEYEVTHHVNHLGYKTVKPIAFTLQTIPPFLEASARALKLGPEYITEKDIAAIEGSDLYDKKLRIYKTCASIDDAPFEIGRVHAFTKGWLERECDFLHMAYKFLLGLLKAGYGKRFLKATKSNWTMNLDPEIYGRNPTEASSFIVPTCNPDDSKHGRGFFARLTGANAEFINMYVILFAGEKIFRMEEGELVFSLNPKLPASFFDGEGKAKFLLFSEVEVTYLNPDRIDCLNEPYGLTYVADGVEYPSIRGEMAGAIRDGKTKHIEVRIHK